MKKEYPRFHGARRAIIITVAEGLGTEESPITEIDYAIEENGVLIGEIRKEAK